MPKKIQKSLQDYISKMKKNHQPIQLASDSISSSKNWILSGCKHPKTLSFAVSQSRKPPASASPGDHHENDEAATLSDIDRFLYENFKSLYLEDQEPARKARPDPVFFESPRFVNPPPDLCGSNRFFVATPGSSGSLVEENRTTTTTTTTTTDTTSDSNSNSSGLPERCIAVLTSSTSPVEDFQRSMQEVIDAKLEEDEESKIDWEYMEELLFCYLNMNDKKSHKYILSAFVDQIVALRQRSDPDPDPDRPRGFARSRRRNRGTIRRDDH